jgi:hypothetical protein
MDAMSDSGLFGRRMPPSCGGDCESRERGKGFWRGELNDVGGAEPDEYIDTGEAKSQHLIAKRDFLRVGGESGLLRNAPLSSQSLAPLPECTELEDDTELRRTSALEPNSRISFFTSLLCLGLVVPFAGTPPAAAAPALLCCLRVLLPARSSSKRRGRGRRCVRS